jgi:hypothetical protein
MNLSKDDVLVGANFFVKVHKAPMASVRVTELVGETVLKSM